MFVQKRKTQFELAINEKQKRMTKLNVKGKSRLIKQTKAYIHNTLHYSNKQKAGVRDFGVSVAPTHHLSQKELTSCFRQQRGEEYK